MRSNNWATTTFILLVATFLCVNTARSENGLVADPGRAADVEYPAPEFAGRDFWYFLTPVWHELDGVKDEDFVKESGYWNIKFKMNRRNAEPARVLILNELSLWRNGSLEKAEFYIKADERTAKVIRSDALADGKTTTACVISADPRPVLTRYKGVEAQITARFKTSAPLQEFKLSYGNHKNPDIGEMKFFADDIEIKPVSLKNIDRTVIAQFSNVPAAKKITIHVASSPIKIELLDLSPAQAERCLKYPFSPFLLRIATGGMFGLSEENFDRVAAEKILRKYNQTNIGFELAEWDSNYFQMWMERSRFYKDILAYCGPERPKNRIEAEAKLQSFWNWQKKLLFNHVWGMSGSTGFPQYGLEWGGKVAGMELTHHTSTIPHRTLLRFTAGGARQYEKPWLLYLAYYLGKYSPNSLAPEAKKMVKGAWSQAPDAGIAPSYARRLFFISYFMGATFFAFEAQPYGQVNRLADGTHELNPNGLVLKEFYDWTRKNEAERGTWYAPILLLNDYYHGSGRRHDSIWGWGKEGFPLQKSDRMAEHFLRAIDPYDGEPEAWDKPPFSPNIHNSPLGDIFDTAFANPPSGNYPRLEEYPVIVLIDGYTPDPEQALKLRDYVINGGTLVINTIHQKSLPSKLMPATILSQTVEEEGLIIPKIKLDGTRIVLKTASGYPLAVSHKFGNGNVIMTTPEYFLGKDLQQPTPYIGQLLETLQQEVLPFGVDGDIEFVVSRIAPDHWKVLLVNNKGLLKGPIDRKEKFDPKYVANVTLSLPTGAIAKEIYAGTKLKLTGNKVTLEVPPSGVRIIEITNAAFTGKKPSGLLGAWEFDGNIEDSSGNKRHAKGWDVKFTNIGSRSVLDFRQDQERPQVKVDFSLNYPLIAGTFEVWAAPDLDAEWDATAHPAGSGYLISTPMGLFKLYAANGYWGFIYGENRVGPPCGNGKWTHLAVTWSDFEARFYVNGKEITAQTGPIKFSEIGFPYSQYSPSFNIGAYGRGQRRRQFQGLIGGTKLYNRPLSNKEITASYRIGTEIYK